jgi:LysR family transcriptional activator of dmlA
VRFGEPPDARVIARRLAPTAGCCAPRRPTWRAHGTPQSPQDLARHHCIGIRQGDEAYGVWRLTRPRHAGHPGQGARPLSTNDGEIAVNWALAGHGIVLRAEWDIARYLRSGRLVQVLPHCSTPPADIYAVYAAPPGVGARARFVDHLAAHFGKSATRAAGLVAGSQRPRAGYNCDCDNTRNNSRLTSAISSPCASHSPGTAPICGYSSAAASSR